MAPAGGSLFLYTGSQEAQETSQQPGVLGSQSLHEGEVLKEKILVFGDTGAGGTQLCVPISPPYISRKILDGPGGHHPTKNTLTRQSFPQSCPTMTAFASGTPSLTPSAIGRVSGSQGRFPQSTQLKPR